MMHRSVKLKLNLFIALWGCTTAVSGQLAQSGRADQLVDKLWESIGGRENWQNARYFMFSCNGGLSSFAQGERKYLWDKETGNCRFDGTTTDDERVTALFNIHTGEGTVYINEVKLENPRMTGDIVKEVTDEFNRDAKLLFLPAMLDGNQVSYSVAGEKLIGARRYTVVNVENKQTRFDTEVSGQLYVDSQTGRVRQWWPSNRASGYSIERYKSVGSGLVLPTRFNNSENAASVNYPIAAALVHIEGQQFSRP